MQEGSDHKYGNWQQDGMECVEAHRIIVSLAVLSLVLFRPFETLFGLGAFSILDSPILCAVSSSSVLAVG
jgi:hypothetical protein